MERKTMTVGAALVDERTALGRAAVELAEARALRLAEARRMVAAEGISLEEAFARVWKAVR